MLKVAFKNAPNGNLIGNSGCYRDIEIRVSYHERKKSHLGKKRAFQCFDDAYKSSIALECQHDLTNQRRAGHSVNGERKCVPHRFAKTI